MKKMNFLSRLFSGLLFVLLFVASKPATAQTGFTVTNISNDCGSLKFTLSVWEAGTLSIITTPPGPFFIETGLNSIPVTLETTEVVVTNVNTTSTAKFTMELNPTIPGQPTVQLVYFSNYNVPGIFIGRGGSFSSFLTDYSVLPGSSFTQALGTPPLYVSGPIIVNKNFTFNNTTAFNSSCVDWLITPVDGKVITLTLTGTCVWQSACDDFLWTGITVAGGCKLNITNYQVSGTTNSPIIQDAVRAIRLLPNNPILNIKGARFVRNGMGIVAFFPDNAPSSIIIQALRDATFDGNGLGNSIPLLPLNECGTGEWNTLTSNEPTLDYQNDQTLMGVYLKNVINVINWKASTNFNRNVFQDMAIGIELLNTSLVVAPIRHVLLRESMSYDKIEVPESSTNANDFIIKSKVMHSESV